MNPEMLSSRIRIGKKMAPNRIVNQPMECNDGDASGNPTDLTFQRYRRLAEGRAGIIVVESVTPSYESRARKTSSRYLKRQLEVFDTPTDPLEMNNLAMDRKKNSELLLALNDKLNKLIDAEVGEDRGQMLPGGVEGGWDITPETMAP